MVVLGLAAVVFAALLVATWVSRRRERRWAESATSEELSETGYPDPTKALTEGHRMDVRGGGWHS